MKVKIKPIIDIDASGKINVPISNFRVINEVVEQIISDIDTSTPEGKIIAKMQNHSITPLNFCF